ncbi:MAG: hypothetical protein SPK09_03760 [Porphyromonas sp.]|nr:hypothetical protein [Porphyromonas sp.]
MEKLIIRIEATSDHFDSYAENVDGVWGGGATPQEALDRALEAARIIAEEYPPEEVPAILLGEYQVVVHYDVASLLKHYGKIITMPALSRLTGINDKQLHHYIMGKSKPRPQRVAKIEAALHKLGEELISLRLS